MNSSGKKTRKPESDSHDPIFSKFSDFVTTAALELPRLVLDLDYDRNMSSIRSGLCKLLGDAGDPENVNSRGDVFLLAMMIVNCDSNNVLGATERLVCFYMCVILLGYDKLRALQDQDMIAMSKNSKELLRKYYAKHKDNPFLLKFLNAYTPGEPKGLFEALAKEFGHSPSSSLILDDTIEPEPLTGERMSDANTNAEKLDKVRRPATNPVQRPQANQVIRPPHVAGDFVVRPR